MLAEDKFANYFFTLAQAALCTLFVRNFVFKFIGFFFSFQFLVTLFLHADQATVIDIVGFGVVGVSLQFTAFDALEAFEELAEAADAAVTKVKFRLIF